jgi:hypothetical protein|tara:strand:- start:13288 stop:14019 length:732 start_codon:yes stop_codon:yes gene_type:complete
MANQYFENFPTTQYKLSNGKWITIKDFFRKSKIDQAALNNVIDYEYYELTDGERPDVVATKLYGNGDLHWTLLLVNDMESYFDWHKDTQTFEVYLKQKFPGQWLTFNNSSDMITTTEAGVSEKFLLGEKITAGDGNTGHVTKCQPTYKRIGVESLTEFTAGDTITGDISGKTATVLNAINQIDGISYYEDTTGLRKNNFASGFTSVTHWQDEFDRNETKRLIKIIRPTYIRKVVQEFDRIMST